MALLIGILLPDTIIWPLCVLFLQGLEQLRSGILQQKSFIQNQQQLHQQIQMLTPQQQQQLMLQAQQNMSSPTSSDVDNRRLRMMLNRNAVLGRDGQTNSGSDIIPNIGSPSQSGGDIDMLIKVYLFYFCLLALHFLQVVASLFTIRQSYMTVDSRYLSCLLSFLPCDTYKQTCRMDHGPLA